jgi:hypothetical protein
MYCSASTIGTIVATFVVPKFLLPLETLDFTGVYLPVDFKVGRSSG